MDDFFDSFKQLPKIKHTTRVVHFKKEDYDIYIGRLPGGKFNKWVYPKELRDTFPKDTPRKVIIEAYRDYILSNPELLNDLHELRDKILGCWCKPNKSCHGDILVELISKYCHD